MFFSRLKGGPRFQCVAARIGIFVIYNTIAVYLPYASSLQRSRELDMSHGDAAVASCGDTAVP